MSGQKRAHRQTLTTRPEDSEAQLRKVELALRASEERYRGFVEDCAYGFFELDLQGRITAVNRATCQFAQCRAEDLIGRRLTDFVPDDEQPRVMENLQMVLDGQPNDGPRVHRLRNAAGEIREMEVNSIAVYRDTEIVGVQGTLADVTELRAAQAQLAQLHDELEARVAQRTAELARANEQLVQEIAARRASETSLRESEEKFRRVAEKSPNMIFISQSGRVVFASEACEPILGYSREELCAPDFDFYRLIAPESLPVVKQMYARHAAGKEVAPYEYGLLTKDGRRLDVINASRLIAFGGKPAILGIVTDVTQQRRVEEELAKVERLDSIGLLAGGIAHDFNNILTAVLGCLGLADTMTGANPGLREVLRDAERATLRARDLTGQLLTFAKGGAPVRETASVAELVSESATFAARGAPARLTFALPEDLWAAELDVGQISQVIGNLVLNSIQAMPEGGVIDISCANIRLGSGEVIPLAEGRYVMISVRDHGRGIAPEHLGRIFDPYYTPKSGGSGLGLTTAYSIVKRHGGCIQAISTVGEGSTFAVYLPASDGEPEDRAKVEVELASGHGRILVMDDDDMVRQVAVTLLETLGYQAEGVRDGQAAIDRYAAEKDGATRFDAVIMDLTVRGGMGGIEAVAKLKRIDPDVRAIVSSGYSNDPALSAPESYGFCGRLAKPFKIEEIALEVAEITARR
jgi:two-component system cell cycle sensor histidine kinase/response regulator CckA